MERQNNSKQRKKERKKTTMGYQPILFRSFLKYSARERRPKNSPQAMMTMVRAMALRSICGRDSATRSLPLVHIPKAVTPSDQAPVKENGREIERRRDWHIFILTSYWPNPLSLCDCSISNKIPLSSSTECRVCICVCVAARIDPPFYFDQF